MTLTLEQAPDGAPNFCFGLYDQSGQCHEWAEFDWDHAGLATTVGWEPCHCGRTDGTVACEHRTVSDMLADAFDFLADRAGERFELSDYGNPA